MCVRACVCRLDDILKSFSSLFFTIISIFQAGNGSFRKTKANIFTLKLLCSD